MKKMSFKKDFLWAASTSAYQVEGAYNEDGKGLSVQDVKKVPEGTPDFKVCSDHYHRYKEDVKLFSELGLKAYRFSIAWSRILPDGFGKINQKGLDFYNNLIDELLKYGIEPIVTMYHFDLPYELEKKGGWENPEIVSYFEEYAKILFEHFGDKVKYWLTINEQNVMIIHSEQIDGGKSNKMVYQKNHHMLLAQAKAMILCHKMLPKAKIGPALNVGVVYPKSCNPKDILASQYCNAIRNWLYLDATCFGVYNNMALKYIHDKNYVLDIKKGDMEILKAAKPDFIAFNYYNSFTVEDPDAKSDKLKDLDSVLLEIGYYKSYVNEYLKFTEFKWQVDPLGFYITLNEIYGRYRLPLIVTENGLGAYDKLEDGKVHDDYRIDYLREHIEYMKKAVDDGVDVFGYCTWSAIDLISTHQGFDKRYGFIYVNRDNKDIKDLSRIKKDSFYWYNKVIQSNGEDM